MQILQYHVTVQMSNYDKRRTLLAYAIMHVIKFLQNVLEYLETIHFYCLSLHSLFSALQCRFNCNHNTFRVDIIVFGRWWGQEGNVPNLGSTTTTNCDTSVCQLTLWTGKTVWQWTVATTVCHLFLSLLLIRVVSLSLVWRLTVSFLDF